MEELERYKSIKELGKGAQGTVILAYDTILERQVAIKSLHTSLTESDLHKKRFKEESKILASISNHSSIITIHEFIVNDSGCHLIMEYFDGQPLDNYIKNVTGPIEEVKAIAIFSQILDAMKYLHQKKIIHRDIKPSNIMINKEGKVQLLDFGIAKNTENDPSLTVVGESAGYTPMYMSPEHCNGAQITNQSDIYSLGVTLWQMLTGVAPYEGLTQGQIYMKVASEPLPSVQSVYEHVSVKMNAVVQKATHKTPKNRYKTCNAFLKAINDVKNHINSPETVFLHKLSIKIENDLEGDILMNNFAHKGSEYAESFAANTPITIVVEKDGYKKFEKTLFLSDSKHLDILLEKDKKKINKQTVIIGKKIEEIEEETKGSLFKKLAIPIIVIGVLLLIGLYVKNGSPKTADAYYNRGVSKSDLNDYNGAIVDYTKSIEIDPNYADAYLNRGNSKFALKDHNGAIADYTKSIALDPTAAVAYSNRGISKENIGDLNAACLDWKEAAKLGHTDAAQWVRDQCN